MQPIALRYSGNWYLPIVINFITFLGEVVLSVFGVVLRFYSDCRSPIALHYFGNWYLLWHRVVVQVSGFAGINRGCGCVVRSVQAKKNPAEAGLCGGEFT
jgi:hypothetical protein